MDPQNTQDQPVQDPMAPVSVPTDTTVPEPVVTPEPVIAPEPSTPSVDATIPGPEPVAEVPTETPAA